MTRKEAEAAVDAIHRLAMTFFCNEPNETEDESDETQDESGKAENESRVTSGQGMLRSMVLRTLLSPAPESGWRRDPSNSDPPPNVWLNIPVFEGLDGKLVQYDDSKGEKLVKKALDGDADADAALCEIAFKYVLFGCELPPNLRAYIALLLRRRSETPGRRRRGGDKYANVDRNVFIVGALTHLKHRGFKPTRNRESKNDRRESGCSIVAQALKRIGIHITEVGIEEVWRQREAFKIR